MAARVLLLGLDAAEPTLVRRWAAEGKLPAISSMIARGTTGSVRGVHGFFVGSTWPSFYTGLNPAGHGFHRVDQLASGSYEFFRPLDTPGGIGGTPFWRQAAAAGRRVAVLDVPLAPLEPELNGIQVVDWGGEEFTEFRTRPRELRRDLLAGVGAYPAVNASARTPSTADEHVRFVEELELAIATKARMTRELLEREHWDLFVQVFLEAHFVGHACWHVHDSAHPSHDPHVGAALSDPVERVYRALDRAVGEIVEQAGAAQILLFSLHGMAAWRGANFVLPEILYRLGATTRPAPARRVSRPLQAAAAMTSRTRFRRWATERSSEGGSLSRWADVATSRCFPVPNGAPVSGIRLNLAGREPAGVLGPGDEAEEFCDRLAADLLEIVNVDTGSPLARAVERTDALYTGGRRDALPDLLVHWDDAVAVGTSVHAGGSGATVRASSAKIGLVEGRNTYGRTGDHVPAGFFVRTGAGVPVSVHDAPVDVVDFHPSVSRLLDVAPNGADGTVVRALVGQRA